MKDYTFKENEVELIRSLLNNPPKRIWWNFICYIFEYDNFHHVRLDCVDKVADSQNNSDEAITAEISKENKEYQPTDNAKLVCENLNIDKAYIVRTFLYFTTSKKYSKSEQFANQTIQKIKSALTGKKDPVGDLLAQSVAEHEEVICHPESDLVKNVNPDHSNILDVGLLLEINGKYLRAYLENNGYGFHIWNEQYFFEQDEFKDDIQLYNFIPIEK